MFVYQTEKTETLPFIRMLKEKSVVLDFEGFRHQKNTFIVKELAITNSDNSDYLIFLPPVNFSSLPKSEQKAYNWLTNYLHGLHWDSGDYLYLNLNQIIQSFVLRNPNAVFYAKGKEKADFLSNYLDRKVVNLDDLGCPRVEQLYFKNFVNCNKHLPHHNSKNHYALKKSKAFFDWLKNECQQRASGESGDIHISKFSSLCLDDTRK